MASTQAKTIQEYNSLQTSAEQTICVLLKNLIDQELPKSESKLWHGGPVWFLEGNPIVGYSHVKSGIKLMFWSGADFEVQGLKIGSGKFKDASITYTTVEQIDEKLVMRWLEQAQTIQWDYKNIVKLKGKLVRLGN